MEEVRYKLIISEKNNNERHNELSFTIYGYKNIVKFIDIVIDSDYIITIIPEGYE